MKKTKAGVSKAQWLEAALGILAAEGIHAVRVDRLARELGVARAGFYWHFRDRPELYREMCAHWGREYTTDVTGAMTGGSPHERLVRTAEAVLDGHLARYDVSMRAWAATDPVVAREVQRVYQYRRAFVRALFAELGFEGDDLEMRTRLFVCYQTWERPMFFRETKKELRRHIESRVALLTTPSAPR